MYHDSVHKIYKQHGVIGTYDNDRNVCERWEYAEMNKDVCGSLTFSPSVFFLVWIIRDSLVVFRTRKCMFFARRRNCHEFYLKNLSYGHWMFVWLQNEHATNVDESVFSLQTIPPVMNQTVVTLKTSLKINLTPVIETHSIQLIEHLNQVQFTLLLVRNSFFLSHRISEKSWNKQFIHICVCFWLQILILI